jgi:hypothetical protein
MWGQSRQWFGIQSLITKQTSLHMRPHMPVIVTQYRKSPRVYVLCVCLGVGGEGVGWVVWTRTIFNSPLDYAVSPWLMPFDVGNKTPKLLIFMRQFPRKFFPSSVPFLVYYFNTNLIIMGFYVLQCPGQIVLTWMGHFLLNSAVIWCRLLSLIVAHQTYITCNIRKCIYNNQTKDCNQTKTEELHLMRAVWLIKRLSQRTEGGAPSLKKQRI